MPGPGGANVNNSEQPQDGGGEPSWVMKALRWMSESPTNQISTGLYTAGAIGLIPPMTPVGLTFLGVGALFNATEYVVDNWIVKVPGATDTWIKKTVIGAVAPMFGGDGDLRKASLIHSQFDNLVSTDGPFHANGKEVTREEYIQFLKDISDPMVGIRQEFAQIGGQELAEANRIIELARARAEFALQKDPNWQPPEGQTRMPEEEMQKFAERQMHEELRNIYEQAFLRRGIGTPDATQEWVLRSKDVGYISKFLGISEDAARAYKTDIMLNWLEEGQFMFGRKPKIDYATLYAALVDGEDPDKVYGRVIDQFRFQESILKLVTGFLEKFLGKWLDKIGINPFQSPVNDMSLLDPEVPAGMSADQFGQQATALKDALDAGKTAAELKALGLNIAALEAAGLGDLSINGILQKIKAGQATADQEKAFEEFLAANGGNPVFARALTQSSISADVMKYLKDHGAQQTIDALQKSSEAAPQVHTVESYATMIKTAKIGDYQGIEGVERLSKELQGKTLQELVDMYANGKLSSADKNSVELLLRDNVDNKVFLNAIQQCVDDGSLKLPPNLQQALSYITHTPISSAGASLPDDVKDQAVLATAYTSPSFAGGENYSTGVTVTPTDLTDVPAVSQNVSLAVAP